MVIIQKYYQQKCWPVLERERLLFWHFVKYNVSTTIIPGPIFTAAALISSGFNGWAVIGRLAIAVVHFMLYIYAFDLSGQTAGVAEDRINKPDRPIPSALISYENACIRLRMVLLLFLLEGFLLGVPLQNAVWVLSFMLYNHTRLNHSWIAKNLNMSIGTWAMLSAAWTIGGGRPDLGAIWILVTAVSVFATVSIQDFRDVLGDAAIGRRTIPILLGSAARPLIAILLISTAVGYHLTLYVPVGWTAARVAIELICVGLLTLLAIRLLALRTRKADKRTYILYTIWYCLHLSAALIVATGR